MVDLDYHRVLGVWTVLFRCVAFPIWIVLAVKILPPIRNLRGSHEITDALYPKTIIVSAIFWQIAVRLATTRRVLYLV